MKDHEIRETINQVRDVAVEFHGAQQLRSRISDILLPVLKVEKITPLLDGVELDLTKGEGHEHPDLNPDDSYLCKIGRNWYFGKFSRQWYGWCFNGWLNPSLQYDKPGWNSSTWERIIKISIKEKVID